MMVKSMRLKIIDPTINASKRKNRNLINCTKFIESIMKTKIIQIESFIKLKAYVLYRCTCVGMRVIFFSGEKMDGKK